MTPALVFLAGLSLSTICFFVAFAVRIASRRRETGLSGGEFHPPVSIVKPLAGLDDELEDNLESFFRLDYPAYEVIFSFAGAEDPAFSIARRVADRNPRIPAVFVVDRSEPGGNSKVNRLAAGVRRARHRYLLFSDGNVRVRPDFLARSMAAFSDPRVGLLSHLFRGSWPRTLASRVECLYLNGVLQAATATMTNLLRQPCVVGKSILMSREALDAIGGLQTVREHLAEDYLLGLAVKREGYRVVLSPSTVDTAEVAKLPRAVWDRHRRWAIMRRRLAGPAYAVEVLASPVPWFAGAVLYAGGDFSVLAAAAAILAARYAAECAAAWEERHPMRAFDLPLLIARDVALAGLFWAGLFGRTTAWRGRRIRVGSGTRIERYPGGRPRTLPPLTPDRIVAARTGSYVA